MIDRHKKIHSPTPLVHGGEIWRRRKAVRTRRPIMQNRYGLIHSEEPCRYKVYVLGVSGLPWNGVLYKRMDGENRKVVSRQVESFLRDFEKETA